MAKKSAKRSSKKKPQIKTIPGSKLKMVRHEKTGIWVIKLPRNSPKVTDEMVKKLLEDFP